MLLIRTEGDCSETMSPELHQVHLRKVLDYINRLKSAGLLISAQPLTMQGSIMQGVGAAFKDGAFAETKEVIAGYYVFKAKDVKEAREIAMTHPILEDEPTARVELREVKMEVGINC